RGRDLSRAGTRGWDPKRRKHIRDVIVSEKVTHKGSYFEVYHVSEQQRAQSRSSCARTLVEGNSTPGGVVDRRGVRLLRGAPDGRWPRMDSAAQMTWARSGAQP